MSAHQARVEFQSHVDATRQTTCELARALIGAHQAAMSLIVAGDWLHARVLSVRETHNERNFAPTHEGSMSSCLCCVRGPQLDIRSARALAKATLAPRERV
jgi:hypothetical protein